MNDTQQHTQKQTQLIDSPSPSLKTPVICYVFYAIFNIFILFLDDIFANLISFSLIFNFLHQE